MMPYRLRLTGWRLAAALFLAGALAGGISGAFGSASPGSAGVTHPGPRPVVIGDEGGDGTGPVVIPHGAPPP
jgi:hypothetical protein